MSALKSELWFQKINNLYLYIAMYFSKYFQLHHFIWSHFWYSFLNDKTQVLKVLNFLFLENWIILAYAKDVRQYKWCNNVRVTIPLISANRIKDVKQVCLLSD